MLRTGSEAKAKRMVASGSAVAIPLAALLVGLSLVVFSLRKSRVNVGLEVRREN